MIDMNVTPLIDVMLVLLIMFIITIPVQTHAVKLDLPQNTNTPPPPVLPDEKYRRGHRPGPDFVERRARSRRSSCANILRLRSR